MMSYRLITAGLAAGGGLLTAAFLQAALAVADTNEAVGPSADGADAFKIGNYTFDPFSNSTGTDVEGFSLVHPLTSAPPLLTLGGGNPGGLLPTAPQYFEVYGSDGKDLGSINSSVVVTNLAGFTNTQFTVTDATAAAGGSVAGLPSLGSVYDVFNFGGGFANIYTAVAGVDGAKSTVTDTFVTPFGNMDLTSLFGGIDASAPLQPGEAFTALHAGAAGGGADAFAIGGYTLDPFTGTGDAAKEGFAAVPSLGGAAPFLAIGGASLGDPSHLGNALAVQSFDVYSGSGDSATQIGTISTGVDVTNLLGLTNTQLVVTGGEGTGVPAVGTVYDAFNFGGGFANVYTATPGEHGTITDTFITPFGSMDLSSLFSGMGAGIALDPGAAFTGLAADTVAGGKEAFAIGSTTFDPFTGSGADEVEGYGPVYQTIGSPPLLNIGGGTPGLNLGGTWYPLPLTTQDFNIYNGVGAHAALLGSVHTQETVTQLLGLTNTSFVVGDVSAAAGVEAVNLPAVGSVYDVFNLGGGFMNIYTAIPGLDGAASTVTDTFVTPFGDFDLSSLFGGFDASALLNPGDAFAGW